MQRPCIPGVIAEKIYEQFSITYSFENPTICRQPSNKKVPKTKSKVSGSTKDMYRILFYVIIGLGQTSRHTELLRLAVSYTINLYGISVLSQRGNIGLRCFHFRTLSHGRLVFFFAWFCLVLSFLNDFSFTSLYWPHIPLPDHSSSTPPLSSACRSDLTPLCCQWMLPGYL